MRILQVGLGGFGRDWAVTVIPQVTEVEVVGTADVFAGSRELAIAAGIVLFHLGRAAVRSPSHPCRPAAQQTPRLAASAAGRLLRKGWRSAASASC